MLSAQTSRTVTQISALGLQSSEPLRTVIADEPGCHYGPGPGSDVIVLAIGSLSDLQWLRYRRTRRTPFAVLSTDLPDLQELMASLRVPYITYGQGERAHIRIEQTEGCAYKISTPVGEICLNLDWAWDAMDCLAAIGVGLALRIPLESLVERLETAAATKVRPLHVYQVKAA